MHHSKINCLGCHATKGINENKADYGDKDKSVTVAWSSNILRRSAGNYMGDLLEDAEEKVELAEGMLIFWFTENSSTENVTIVRSLQKNLESIRKLMT